MRTVPYPTPGEIVAGERAVTADTEPRLLRYFGTSDKFWTGLQLSHDQALAKEALAGVLAEIKPFEHA